MINRDRFKDADWYELVKTDVLIGGAGGTGSWLSFLLARAGSKITIFDFDTIEAHNLGGQLYSIPDINKFKVVALYDIIKLFCGEEINAIIETVNEDTMTNKFVFSCFDNMAARKIMFDSWVKGNKLFKDALFVDLRLILEQANIFCVKNNETDIENYRRNLFDDSEVPDAPCTARQTSDAAAMIAAKAISYFKNHLININAKSNKRFVPFAWENFMPLDATSYEIPNIDNNGNDSDSTT